ncbi:MAG: rhodanese-related sulfurtransferase [Bacteroidia bacterium]|nr:rhodanese-related sulfurtransferase [Bacteroidia bacterium]
MQLHNKINKDVLKELLRKEAFKRRTLSFYRYVIIQNPVEMRDRLYLQWNKLSIFGRVYIAKEGINAQISVPEHHWDTFVEELYALEEFNQVPFKIAVEDDGKSFYKLIVRIKERIVADGLPENSYDVTNVGTHLDAENWNKAMETPGTVVVDMRNHYESEVGHFEGAILPDADTFKQELEMVTELLKGKESDKVLLYCTGGIRCEKASAYLRHQGFQDVNQLHGGIIAYAQQIKEKGLESKFHGKNFVFDERLGERITDEIISKCHQCGEPCDTHTNCANSDCHLLFIQCPQCAEKFQGCCTKECQNILNLPLEKQIALRKGKTKEHAHAVYKSRLRPKLLGQ